MTSCPSVVAGAPDSKNPELYYYRPNSKYLTCLHNCLASSKLPKPKVGKLRFFCLEVLRHGH